MSCQCLRQLRAYFGVAQRGYKAILPCVEIDVSPRIIAISHASGLTIGLHEFERLGGL